MIYIGSNHVNYKVFTEEEVDNLYDNYIENTKNSIYDDICKILTEQGRSKYIDCIEINDTTFDIYAWNNLENVLNVKSIVDKDYYYQNTFYTICEI